MFVDLTLCRACGAHLGYWRGPLYMCPPCERVHRAAIGEPEPPDEEPAA